MAMGRGEVPGRFTVPAINLRMMAYDSARAVFRAARKLDVGALIFEIARSEIGYTDQRPAEYATAVLAAAIREGFRGPVFIQGDHFQTSGKKYAAAPEAGDPGHPRPDPRGRRGRVLQHRHRHLDPRRHLQADARRAAEAQLRGLRRFHEVHPRATSRQGVTISVGGEIGEVGQKNSTPEDLDAFMRGYNARSRGR